MCVFVQVSVGAGTSTRGLGTPWSWSYINSDSLKEQKVLLNAGHFSSLHIIIIIIYIIIYLSRV